MQLILQTSAAEIPRDVAQHESGQKSLGRIV